MPSFADWLRDSAIAKQMFSARYGEQDPYVLATQNASQLGYPSPGATADVGEAQRYEASRLAAQKYGILPLLTNPLHEAILSWGAEGENGPNLKRLNAGYRGTFDALEEARKKGGHSLSALLASAVAGE